MNKLLTALILVATAATAQAGPWTYSKTVDKMDPSFLQNNAVLSSTNKLNFSFPYNGGSQGFVVVNKVSGTNNINIDGYHIAFTVSKGQLTCSSPCVIRIKFDNETPITMYANSTSDKNNRLTLNFLYQPGISKDQFLSKLSSANKLMIEASFYQEGSQVFEFDTSGFKKI